MRIFIYLIMGIMLVGLGSATITFDNKISELTDYGQYQYMYAGFGNVSNTSRINAFQSAWTLPPTDFQLFQNDSGDGDYIWFGWSRGTWHNLTLNITTPVNITGLNLTWQYHSGSYGDSESDFKDLNVTENTCGDFNQTGICNIDFDCRTLPHTDMGAHPFKIRAVVIRARINGNPVVHNGGLIAGIDGNDYAITIPENDNVDIEDLVSADSTGNWSMIDNMNEYYFIKSNLVLIGNLTIDDNELVQLGNLTYKRQLLKDGLSKLQIGLKDSNNMTYDSSVFIYVQPNNIYEPYDYWSGTTNIYNSMVLSYQNSLRQTAPSEKIDFQNSIWEITKSTSGDIFYIESGASGLMKNFIISKMLYGYFYSANVEMDNVIISKFYTGASYNYLNRGDLKNMDLNYPYKQMVGFGFYGHDYPDLINCDIGDEENYTAHTKLISSGSIGMGGRIKYDFTLDLKDENYNPLIANVTLTDSYGNVYWNNSNFSKNETRAVVYHIINEANATGTYQNKYYFNPYNITIQTDGYNTYTGLFNITYDNRYMTLIGQTGGDGLGDLVVGNALVIKKGESPSVTLKTCS